jgi:hypothetical protein
MARNDGQGLSRVRFGTTISTFEGYEFSRDTIAYHSNSTLSTNSVTIAAYLEGRFTNSRRQPAEGFSFQQGSGTFNSVFLLTNGFGNAVTNSVGGSSGLIDARYYLALDTPNAVLCALSGNTGRLIKRRITTGATRFDTVFGAETVVQITCVP